jgi:protein-tyrosine phosphatase
VPGTLLTENSLDSLTELPFGLPGKIYRSPMPFGPYDSAEIIFEAYKSNNVSVVVVLAEEDECLQKAKRNLHAFYTQEGLEVIRCPIRDFSVPSLTDLQTTLNQTISHAGYGRNVAIHCSAGIGRTGLFAALLARVLLGFNGEEAIQWVRRYIDSAVETPEQRQFVISATVASPK